MASSIPLLLLLPPPPPPPPTQGNDPLEFISPYVEHKRLPIFNAAAGHGIAIRLIDGIDPCRDASPIDCFTEHENIQKMNDACKSGNLTLLKSLVIDWKTCLEPPPGPPGYEIYALEPVFYTAIRESQKDVLEYFLDQGILMCKLAIEEALESVSSPGIFQAFFDRGWDVNGAPLSPKTCGFPYSPLCQILQKGDHEELVKWFLSHGADPNASSGGGYHREVTNFMWAALNNSYSIVQFMYQACGRPVGPILPCAMKRRVDRVRVMTFLLDIGADINATESEYDQLYYGPAINFASSAEGDEELEILLERGARLDIRNFEGDTCLDIAKRCGMERKIKLLETYIERNDFRFGSIHIFISTE